MNDSIPFKQAADMEPLMPTHNVGELEDIVCELLRAVGGLGALTSTVTRRQIADLLRSMNSYYSNLIEGHRTTPYEIEKALQQVFSSNQKQRELQEESVAHIRAQQAMERRLARETEIDLFSADWLCWLHAEFYRHVPENFKCLKDGNGREYKMQPGELRKENVSVGRHVAPHHEILETFLHRFATFYNDPSLTEPKRIIAIAAAHHRLAWIHPFMDGNGRVVRLFSHALFVRRKLDADGLWSLSRGLARTRERYMESLAKADETRSGDYDGRGRMSDKALTEFCRYFLLTALDQVRFMTELLDLDGLERRIEKYLALTGALGRESERAKHLLWEALRRGEIARGEAGRITNQPERTARNTLKAVIDCGLLTSDSAKGLLRIAFPASVLEYYFPLLYPEGVAQGP